MSDLHFLRPYWLLALLPTLTLWWLLWRRQNVRGAWRRTIDPHLLEHLLVGEKRRARVRPVHLLLLVWALSVVALAGPAWRREPSPFAEDEAGLVVLLKVTGSMMATDVQPSRLERAKHKIRDLLEDRAGAVTALIAYSGSAHLVMPLTRDARLINAMAEELSPEILPVEGDALPEALGHAQGLLERAGVAGSILVIADTVAPTATEARRATRTDGSPPVQFLAIQAPEAALDPGLRDAADEAGGSVTRMTVDDSDVRRVSRTAKREIQAASLAQAGDRWRDSGYALVPVIVLLALLWVRKGWLVSEP